MEEAPIQFIEANESWADKYRVFCQKAYQAAYSRPELGITREHFSPEVFASKRIRKYFKDSLKREPHRKFWIAVRGREILGGVGATRYANYCEIKNFYVKPKLKGQGLGGRLFRKVVEYAGDLPIQADVVEYMSDTIAMYKHWGFKVDESKGVVEYLIEEWPEPRPEAYRGIIMIKPVPTADSL